LDVVEAMFAAYQGEEFESVGNPFSGFKGFYLRRQFAIVECSS
jgi:hypothetical protein